MYVFALGDKNVMATGSGARCYAQWLRCQLCAHTMCGSCVTLQWGAEVETLVLEAPYNPECLAEMDPLLIQGDPGGTCQTRSLMI